MIRRIKTSVLLFSVFFMLSCNSTLKRPQQIADAAAAPRFRIALVTIQEPLFYQAKILHYRIPNPTVTLPGRISSFGLITVAKGLDVMAHNYNLSQLLHEQHFALSQYLSAQVKKELAGVGYEVVDAPLFDHRHASELRGGFCLNEPPISEPCANYYLHVVIDFAGYVASTQGQPFVPLLRLRVQLVSVTGDNELPQLSLQEYGAKKDSDAFRLIYAATFTYGGLVPVEGATDALARPEFALRDDEALRQAQRIMAGLQDGANQLARKIASNLR